MSNYLTPKGRKEGGHLHFASRKDAPDCIIVLRKKNYNMCMEWLGLYEILYVFALKWVLVCAFDTKEHFYSKFTVFFFVKVAT